MSKIKTLTLNSAIEEVAYIDNIDGKECVIDMKEYYTGKAVNTGIVISNIGCECEIIVVSGENTRKAYSDFSGGPRKVTVFPVSGNTRINRTNVYINNHEEKIINKGYCLNDDITNEIFEYVVSSAEKDDLIMIAGSLPGGVSDDWYCRLIDTLQRKGVKVFFDAAKSTLIAGVKSSPFYIKPNEEEITVLIGDCEQTDIKEKLINISVNNNIDNVMVTLGEKGVIGYNLSENVSYHVFSEQDFGRDIMTTGCGDSFNAGFIFGTSCMKGFLQSLIYGVAFASANITAGFPEKIRMDTIEECIRYVKYSKI